MDVATGLIRDIDQRVKHIHAQVGMGATLEEVAAEQAGAILRTFSQTNRIDLGVITQVSTHLQTNGVWSRAQLSEFSACLRANAATRLHQPGTRPMQSNPCLEYYFLEEDWDKLQNLSPPAIQEIIAVRLHAFGMVCLDASSLKRASAIVQACSGTAVSPDDKRQYAHDVRTHLKTLDRDSFGTWPFQYIRKYPRSPFELPEQILDHACGRGKRPVAPPGKFEGSAFHLLVKQTPYKKQRLNQTPAKGAIVPVPSQAAAASPGLNYDLLPAMMHALMQAAVNSYEHSMARQSGPCQNRSATGQAYPPALMFGPFSRKPSSHAVTELDGSCAPMELDGSYAPTELDEDEGTGHDELGKLEADMAKSKKAVEETSASDPAAGKIAKRPAASIAKRPAASIAAACGTFDIEQWVKDNLDETEAAEESARRYFVDRLHHRGYRAAKLAGLSDKDACEARTCIRAKAGKFYDVVHKRG